LILAFGFLVLVPLSEKRMMEKYNLFVQIIRDLPLNEEEFLKLAIKNKDQNIVNFLLFHGWAGDNDTSDDSDDNNEAGASHDDDGSCVGASHWTKSIRSYQWSYVCQMPLVMLCSVTKKICQQKDISGGIKLDFLYYLLKFDRVDFFEKIYNTKDEKKGEKKNDDVVQFFNWFQDRHEKVGLYYLLGLFHSTQVLKFLVEKIPINVNEFIHGCVEHGAKCFIDKEELKELILFLENHSVQKKSIQDGKRKNKFGLESLRFAFPNLQMFQVVFFLLFANANTNADTVQEKNSFISKFKSVAHFQTNVEIVAWSMDFVNDRVAKNIEDGSSSLSVSDFIGIQNGPYYLLYEQYIDLFSFLIKRSNSAKDIETLGEFSFRKKEEKNKYYYKLVEEKRGEQISRLIIRQISLEKFYLQHTDLEEKVETAKKYVDQIRENVNNYFPTPLTNIILHFF
jgi:hypothetical protein